MTPIETVQALVAVLEKTWRWNVSTPELNAALSAGRAFLAQETAASRATECEQKQPNTDQVHLVEGGNTAACGDKAGTLRGGTWQPIATAPKDGTPLLLWFPALGHWLPGFWRGSWSFVAREWVIHTPYQNEGKNIVATELPQPTHWMLAAAPAADEGMPK